MTITVRSDDPTGWSKTPHTLARDPRLSNGARGLAVQMLSHADGFRSDEEFLAACSADSRNAIRRQLAELRQFGYLVRERVRGEDGKLTTRSVLYDVPQGEQPVTGSPSRQHPASRSDHGRFQPTGNPPHAAPWRDGATSANTEEPQAAPTRRPSATRPDQPEQRITAGRADSPDPGAQSEDQKKIREKISQSAQHREACRWLHREYGLTDEQAALVITEAHRRAPTPIRNLAGYLAGMVEDGSLADIVGAVQDATDPTQRPHADQPHTEQPPPLVDQAPARRSGPDRSVAEAIAQATPDHQPDRPRPPAPGTAPNVTRLDPRPECPHGHPGGTHPRPGDGEPECVICRMHRAACRREPGTCPTCRAIEAAGPGTSGGPIARPA